MWYMKQTEDMAHIPHVNGWFPGDFKELHESKLPFVSAAEFIRSKLSIFSARVCGVAVIPRAAVVEARAALQNMPAGGPRPAGQAFGRRWWCGSDATVLRAPSRPHWVLLYPREMAVEGWAAVEDGWKLVWGTGKEGIGGRRNHRGGLLRTTKFGGKPVLGLLLYVRD